MPLKSMLVGTAMAVLCAKAAAAETWSSAVTDVEGIERPQTEWGPFKTAQETVTGATFDVFPVSTHTAATEALRGGTVDFVITGRADYIVINTLTEATPLIGFGRPDDRCAVIVRAEPGIDSMHDLRGRTVAFGDVGSTSNMLCPMQRMADYGVDPVIDIERVHTAREKDTSVPHGFFRVPARSGDLPNDMMMAGAHVPADVKAMIRDAIIDTKTGVITAITSHEENGKYLGMDLVTIEDADDDVVRSMYAPTGYPQLDTFIGE